MDFFRKYNKKSTSVAQSAEQKNNLQQDETDQALNVNIAIIKSMFTETPDLIIRKFVIKQTEKKLRSST